MTEPDYASLQLILEKELDREVSLEEATGTGDFLLNVYEILLNDKEKVIKY